MARLIKQRRGKNSPCYRSKYYLNNPIKLNYLEKNEMINAIANNNITIENIEKFNNRKIPVMVLKINDKIFYNITVMNYIFNIKNIKNSILDNNRLGGINILKNLNIGTKICNIKINNNLSIARAPGQFFIIKEHLSDNKTIIFKTKNIIVSSNTLCTIGQVSCSDITSKKFLKYGNKYHSYKNKKRKLINVAKVAMNARDHPYGGGKGRVLGQTKHCAHGDPVGKKAGAVSPRRQGHKNKK